MKKPNLTLIKALHVLCIVFEVSAALGLAVLLCLAPFAPTLVRDGRANVRLYVGHGAMDWGFRLRLSKSSHADVSYGSLESGTQISSGDGAAEPAYGRVSFGSLGVRPEPARAPDGGAAGGRDFAVEGIEGTVAITRPDLAAQALASAQGPLLVSLLGSGGIGLAILEVLRRILGSARRGDVFTPANILRVQGIGWLLVAFPVAKIAASAWLVSRMGAFLAEHAAGTGWLLDTSFRNGVSLAPGILVVALAGVFRQGLELKQDSELTV